MKRTERNKHGRYIFLSSIVPRCRLPSPHLDLLCAVQVSAEDLSTCPLISLPRPLSAKRLEAEGDINYIHLNLRRTLMIIGKHDRSMTNLSSFLIGGFVLLSCTQAFVPSQNSRSTLFLPKLTRNSPRFAEEEFPSSVDSQPTKTLLQRIDDAGMSLKPRAIEAKEKLTTMRKPSKKLRYTLQSCLYFALFILYRAYRGFFVILPAVFKEVYSTMGKTVQSPFSDLEEPADLDINPKTGRLRLRTAVTVSILAGIVTLSYTLSGAMRVLGSFIRTISKTSSPSMSFLAAANEMETNESKIMNLARKKKKSSKINGDPLDGMAP